MLGPVELSRPLAPILSVGSKGQSRLFQIQRGKLFIVSKTGFLSGPAVAQRILKSEKLGRASDLPKEEETL